VNGAPFVTAGGLGLAADAALAANRLRRSARLRRAIGALGTRVYPLAAAGAVLFRPMRHRIRLAYRDPDGRTHALERACAALLVANQGSLGGRLALPTASRNDDGVFELCLVPAVSRLRLLATLARLARGRADDSPSCARARPASRAIGRSGSSATATSWCAAAPSPSACAPRRSPSSADGARGTGALAGAAGHPRGAVHVAAIKLDWLGALAACRSTAARPSAGAASSVRTRPSAAPSPWWAATTMFALTQASLFHRYGWAHAASLVDFDRVHPVLWACCWAAATSAASCRTAS